MRHLVACIPLTLALAACAQPPGQPERTSVWKSFGSLQCSSSGTTLPALRRELEQGGVRVLAASCGHDGRMRIAKCGAPDGRIGIFEVPQADAGSARQLGFVPLAQLPEAERGACPSG